MSEAVEKRIKEIEELHENHFFVDNPNGSDVKEQIDYLLALVKRYREALEEISEKRRLRDMSQLASNPPQNGAVWDIQVISNRALAYNPDGDA